MTMKDIATYVINLPKAQERKKSITSELSKLGINPVFISALDGHDKSFPFHRYKKYSGSFWRRKDDFKPGAFACYLSHSLCWRKITQSKSPISMVLEDDVCIDHQAFLSFAFENYLDDFDVIFITESARRLTNKSGVLKKFISVSEQLKEAVFEHHHEKRMPAPGGYGYIVSLKGAHKLLQMMESRKISMGVDFAMLFNSLKLTDLKKFMNLSAHQIPFPMDHYIDTERENLLAGVKPIELDSYIYTPAAIVNVKDFPSSINHSYFMSNDVFNKESTSGN